VACLGDNSFFGCDFLETYYKENTQMTYGEWHKQMMEQIQMDKLMDLLEKQNQLLTEIKQGSEEESTNS